MSNRQQSLGVRLRALRERQGLSQEALAGQLGIPRSSLSQVEAGRRNVTADELVRLADLLGVSCDVLLGLEKEPEVVLAKDAPARSAAGGMRISVPQKNLAKFREVLLYVLSRIGARPHVGETVLYKLLYFIDFDYYEKYEEQLIGATYVANKYGPTPVEFHKIVERMEKEGALVRVRNQHFQYEQRKYLPLREPDTSVLTGPELALIDDVLKRLGDMNAAQISAWSHNDVPWLGTKPGKVIPYEAVFYRVPPYSQREYAEAD
ncbi:MAG: type II toxin-antitoxin system antitoxin SocA domain-containing protein [candidate division WOR-3 bacterium]